MIEKITLEDLYDGDSMKMHMQPILDKINQIIDELNRTVSRTSEVDGLGDKT